MSVSNGQPATENTFNSSFMSREVDTSTVGQVDLLNEDAESGAEVENVQREINSQNAYTGRPAGSDHDATPVWTSTNAGDPADTLKERAEALSEKFDDTTGHGHSGDPGDGAPIQSESIEGVPLIGRLVGGTTLTAVTGDDIDVSTELTGKTPSTAVNVQGVVVNSGPNLIILRNADVDELEDPFFDNDGNVVFGRLTEAAGVWTLSFFSTVAGVETVYSFGTAVDIDWYFQELFSPIVDNPTYSELPQLLKSAGGGAGGGMLDVTGDRSNPEEITAVGGIAFTGNSARQMWYIQGDGAHIEVSANPQISDGNFDGQELILVGRNADQTVTLNDGTGLSIKGPWIGGYNDTLGLRWDTDEWVEMFRSN